MKSPRWESSSSPVGVSSDNGSLAILSTLRTFSSGMPSFSARARRANDDGLEGERALAQTGDHRFAAGLDALGNRDLALARQKLHRAHFAQIHAHRIIRALGRLLGLGLGRDLLLDLDQLAALALGLFVGLLARLLA